MKTFITVIMALATLRTIVPLIDNKTYASISKIIAVYTVAITQVIAFWYLCEIFFTTK